MDKKITPEFARCIAKISGDGNLYYRYIRYNNTCKELREEFTQDIQKEFGPITITKGIGNSGTKFVQINRKFVIIEFLKYLPDYKGKSIRVPKSIKYGNKEVQRNYIRSIYDDEGTVGIRLFKKTNEWKRNIKIDSTSKELLEDIRFMLENSFKIKCNNIKKCTKEDKFWYYSGVSGKNNFIKFQKHIGFKHPKKLIKLDLLIRSYGNTFFRNPYKFKKLKKELEKIRSS